VMLTLALGLSRCASANLLARACPDGVLLYYRKGTVITTRKITRFSMKLYGVQRAGFAALKEPFRGEAGTCLLI
jgi:hypothetical protein